MRGPRFPLTSEMAKAGITPACAGTTQSALTLLPLAWDHPRMCGDHKFQGGFINKLWGSPPHVRGPRYGNTYRLAILGITPACAGTTYLERTGENEWRDHPRMCGDHQQAYWIYPSILGSPPHVRGPLLCSHHTPTLLGITPACAGTTNSSQSSVALSGDHPRMCGDH